MKYEKVPTDDYDDDARELSIELSSNTSSEDTPLDTPSESSFSGDIKETNTPLLGLGKPDPEASPSPSSRRACKAATKRTRFIRYLHIFLFLLFTTIVVFTFLPSGLSRLISWRHNRLYGSGSCRSKSSPPSAPTENNTSKNDGESVIKRPMDDDTDLNGYDITNPLSTPYIQLSLLPERYIPTCNPSDEDKTLVIIGDVHGMLDEFKALMQKLEGKGLWKEGGDSHVVLAGDMITKGPNSLGVLDMAMALNASCVRGNHEDEIMGIYWGLKRNRGRKGGKGKGKGNGLDVQEDGDDQMVEHDDDEDDDEEKDEHDVGKRSPEPKKHKKNKDKNKKKHKNKNKHKGTGKPDWKRRDIKLAKSLQPQHAAFIDSCPLILKINSPAKMGDLAVVHAGMVPGVELPHQKPSVLMYIRTFVKHIPTPGGKGIHWSKLWDKYQKAMVKLGQKPLTVVYGHDARRGLEVHKYTKGLDTNCVRGGKLTALVIKGGKHAQTKIVSVKCRKYHH